MLWNNSVRSRTVAQYDFNVKVSLMRLLYAVKLHCYSELVAVDLVTCFGTLLSGMGDIAFIPANGISMQEA